MSDTKSTATDKKETTAPAPPPPKKVEPKKSFWDQYGFLIACIGFGLAFLFLLIIIFLAWRLNNVSAVPPTSDANIARSQATLDDDYEPLPSPSQAQPAPTAQESYDIDASSSTTPSTGPLPSPLKAPANPGQPQVLGRVDGGRVRGRSAAGRGKGRGVGKGKGMKGGCGCSGIAATPGLM